MAVTANQLIAQQDGCKQKAPVAASTRLYQGTLAFITAAGYADDDTATGANKFGGIVVADTDNSSGSAGDLNAELLQDGVFTLTGSSLVQADVGKPCYATDNYTITTTYSAGAVYIGTVVEYVSSTRLRVNIEVDQQGSLVYAAVAASAAVTNTTTQTAFDKSFSFPASSLRPGDVIRVRAQAIATATNSTDTLNVILRVGGTDVLATGAVDVANNDLAFIDADVVIRTIGASGTMVAGGHTALGAAGTVTSKPKLLASTTLDTTAAVAVDVTATWSVASASNSVRLDMLDVQLLRRK